MDGEVGRQGLFKTVPILVSKGLRNAWKIVSVLAGTPAKIGTVSSSVV
jgi:hypothetical protein